MEDMNHVKGRIFDIQRFSIHDGPGIRSIVFLKGCFLRCKWCCNPESQDYAIQTIEVQGKLKIIGRDVTVLEVVEEVKRDMPYYKRSGGGVTLSGGEALFQPEFGSALLCVCKENGINTAMESTGNAKFEHIQMFLPHLDLYLMDIKHMSSTKHKEYTGVSNELILENARKIAESGTKLIIRVPVIPGFNDTKEEIRAIATFAKTLPNVTELHLLPYHRLGQDKYAGLNRPYALQEAIPLSNERMEELLTVVISCGLESQIGG